MRHKQLELITLAVIATNILMLINEIPAPLILLTIASLVLSLVVSNKSARSILKISLLILTMVAIRLNFKNLLVPECGVAFVLVLASLKFWELKEIKDHFNMFLILILSECSLFLLIPSFFVFSFGLLKMIFYFYYLLKIRNYDVGLLNFKRLILLAAPSLLFSLALFLTFPRFTQGFINIAGPHSAKTGVNTEFNFKNLGPITPSSTPVFKARGLEQSGLNLNLVYWRSNVLWIFSNQHWQSGYHNLKINPPTLTNAPYVYKIEYLQKQKEFLPILDGTSVISNTSLPINTYSEGTHRLKVFSNKRLNYEVAGYYGERTYPINDLMTRKGLRLKSDAINQISETLLSGVSRDTTDEQRLKDLIQVFKKRNFEYSLNPPLYDTLEQFIIKGKLGYCTHFAAAFTYLARILELPSRMVVGYLGGELNPYDGSVLVKELDAHAWVEVYLTNKGWVKIDPTSIVAPARLQMSGQDFIQQLNPYLSFFNFRISKSFFKFTALRKLELWLESVNSKLNIGLADFDRDKQAEFIKKLNPLNIPLGWVFVITLLVVMMGYSLLFIGQSKSSLSKNEKQYRKFKGLMLAHGLTKTSFETASQFQIRCTLTLPKFKQQIDDETANYINAFYR